MFPRFDPDAVKQSMRDGASRALVRFGESLRRRQPVDWFAAAVATGAAKDYRLGLMGLLAAWRALSDSDIVVAAKDSLTKVRDFEQATTEMFMEWTVSRSSNGQDCEWAVNAVKNRMALQLAMRGLRAAIDLRHPLRPDSADDPGADESCDHPAPDAAILAFARELSALDERLHRKLIALSAATRTDTLVAMRSLMRRRDFLPWWLDGTLEAVAVAQTVSGEKRAQLNAIMERDPADPEFVRMLVPALDGPRATIGRPTDRIDVNGSWRDVYAWRLPDTNGGGPTTVELVAPSPGGRGRVLELRVPEADGVAAPLEPSFHAQEEYVATRTGCEFLAGRVMLVNGIAFIWFRAGRRVHAKVSMGSSPALPMSGQIQLVDCSTNRVLEPVSPA